MRALIATATPRSRLGRERYRSKICQASSFDLLINHRRRCTQMMRAQRPRTVHIAVDGAETVCRYAARALDANGMPMAVRVDGRGAIASNVLAGRSAIMDLLGAPLATI